MKFFESVAESTGIHPLHNLLHTRMGGTEKERSYLNVHASDLTKEGRDEFCARQRAIRYTINDSAKYSKATTADRFTWDIGKMMHDIVVTKWLTGSVIGNWKCYVCGETLYHCKKPTQCTSCGCREFQYQEIVFEDPETGATGSVDLIVQLVNKGPYVLTELKGIKQEEFKLLEAPIAEHRIRTQIYLELVARSGKLPEIDSTKAYVLYITKGGWGEQNESVRQAHGERWTPFKPFTVKPDPDTAVSYLTKAKPFKEYVNDHVLHNGTMDLPNRICKYPDDKRAKNCSVCQICFGANP